MESIFKKYTQNLKIVGIGTGKTMKLFSNTLPDTFTYVPSSYQTLHFLKNKKIENIQNISEIDIYFDSADFYDENNNLIKGYGGALTKEKLLLKMAKTAVIVVESSKFRKTFESLYVPVEIIKDSYGYFTSMLEKYNLKYKVRLSNGLSPFISDNFNFIIDVEYNLDFLKICKNITGVVEHGYFSNSEKYSIEQI